MSSVTDIVAGLPEPQVVAVPDFETKYAELKADLIADYPLAAAALESDHEPLARLLQRMAYEIVNAYSDRNDSAKAVMLPFAKGADLDNLAIFHGLTRHIITPADPEANPPVAEVKEKDADFLERILLTEQSKGSPGSPANYMARARNAHPHVRSAAATSPEAGQVLISILSTEGDGAADDALCAAVYAALMADPEARILTDEIVVASAPIIEYQVSAVLYLKSGPTDAAVLDEANAQLREFIDAQRKVGQNIAVSGIYRALQLNGIDRVELSSPVGSVLVGPTGAGFCTVINVTTEDDDE